MLVTVWSIYAVSGCFCDRSGGDYAALVIVKWGQSAYNNSSIRNVICISICVKGCDAVSVVIVGGNERMGRRYTDLCRKAKVYLQMSGDMRDFGTPDLLVLFTGTASHKMVRSALSKTDTNKTKIARSHSASMAALKSIMEEYFGKELSCQKKY